MINRLIFLLMLSFLPLRANAAVPSGSTNEPVFLSEALRAKNELETLKPEEMDADWKLNDYFGSVVVINLPRCPDRLEFISDRLNAIGCKRFDVFKGIDGRTEVPEAIWKKFDLNWARIDLSTEEGRVRYDNQRKGEAGCYLSHYNAIKNAAHNYDRALTNYREAVSKQDEALKSKAYLDLLKYRSILVIEDDTGFGIRNEDRVTASVTGAGKVFRSAMSEVPDDWDMLYFMTYCREGSPNEVYKPNLVKVNCGFSAIAYVVSHRMYDRLLEDLSIVEDPNVYNLLPVDTIYARIHRMYRCYAITPSIAYQRVGLSTINSVVTPEIIQFQPLPPL